MSHGAVASASTTGAVRSSLGGRVYSLALRSVTDTKDTLIFVCIALLEALDRLQERLHLPTTLVKELKRKLAKMIDSSSSPSVAHRFGPTGRAVGDKLAESDMWEVAKPEEVRGVVQWTIDVVKYLNHLVVASSLCVCRGIFILILRVPGVSTACALFYRVLQLVEDTVQLSSETLRDMAGAAGSAGMGAGGEPNGNRGCHYTHHRHRPESYIGHPSMTAVVLEYREKECMVPSNIDQRIRRVMHFQIPLRSFEATVRLPPSHGQGTAPNPAPLLGASSAMTDTRGYPPISSSSPRSIPASPRARRRVQLAFSNFSDDVLYQARDRLRLERAATITGTRDLLVPLFNSQDCNEEIYLSCGRHCATKVGPGMYRSVRGNVELPRNRLVYFEMTLQEVRTPTRGSSQTSRMLEARSHVSEASMGSFGAANARVGGGADASVCIGLSTRTMALNSLVGTTRYSVGFYSAGHVLVGANRRSFVAVNRGYGFQSTVGVLVRVIDEREAAQRQRGDGSDRDWGEASRGSRSPQLSIAVPQLAPTATALVRFSVDGVVVRDGNDAAMEFSLPFPAQSELYPTLTLHSQGVQVFGRFSSPDVAADNVRAMLLPREDGEDVWCLDGQRLLLPP